MFCTWSAIAYTYNYLLLNLNHKTLTAEKKKNLQTETKNNYQLCKKCTCTATYVMENIWTLFCTVKKFGNYS